MANYCDCILTLNSDDSTLIDEAITAAIPQTSSPVGKFVQRLFKRAPPSSIGLLQFLCPMSDEMIATVTNGFSGPEPEWRKWRVENWGCAYDPGIEKLQRISPQEVRFEFLSMYTPPIAALQYGVNKYRDRGLTFRIIYSEAGGQFAGEATEQMHKEYEYTLEQHPREDGVPEEIIVAFGLDEYYREHLEDVANES